MEEKIYLGALHSIWITQKKLSEIFNTKKSYKDFYENLNHKKLKNYFDDDKKIEQILKNKSIFDLDKLSKIIEKLDIKIIDIFDESYPDKLKNIYSSPFLIYLRWQIPLPWIAFVGSRKMTEYWENNIKKLIPNLSKYFSIISWWASWCDTHSHKEAIKSKWKTIAVFGTGIDLCYPAWNKKLYEDIITTWWWLISIFPIWTHGSKESFPIRNEIVAWLSEAIVVIEAEEKSGTLITARLWLEQWKDIYAIPWNINNSNSIWCNNLISRGEASLIQTSKDILENFNIKESSKSKENKDLKFNDELEEKIYKLLIKHSFNADEIAKELKENISLILLKLSLLELQGNISKSFSWKYKII